MSLIFSTLQFETKILDIGYLLMLKLMKEPKFDLDLKFILLYVDVMRKQKRYKEALDFIEEKAHFFETNKPLRQTLEQDLLYLAG